MYSEPLKKVKHASIEIKAVDICDQCGKAKSRLGAAADTSDDTGAGGAKIVVEGEQCACPPAYVFGVVHGAASTVAAADSSAAAAAAAEPAADAYVYGTAAAIDSKISADTGLPDLGDRYQVLQLIGRGGMGAVYKVRDKALNKVFAVKVLKPELSSDRVSVKRFEQEAEAAKNLTHANLAAVYDFGVGRSGCPFLVMDYLDGQTLEQVLKQDGYLDAPRALDIFIQAAEAVADAHMKGVIHRDIKPSNIILEKADNGSDFVKLVDFGIAKVLPSQQDAQTNLTQTGDIFGSPLYMSPEQCQGNMQDRRSDIYSLGCVMYEVLTGVQPFADVNPIRVILRHVNEDARAISTLKQAYNVPLDLDKIIMHCLSRDPALRYQSADDLVRDLKKVRDGEKLKLRQPLKAKAQSESLISASTVRRTRLRLVIFATLSALLSIFAMLMIQHAPPAGNPFTGRDPYADAEVLDQQSFYYFSRGEYDKAAPLLEFGIKVYRDLLAGARQRNDDYGIRKLSALLNENLQHLGKCYMMMAQKVPAGTDPAEVANLLQKAKAAYDAAYPFYKQYGNYAGSQFPEFVSDYAQVLRKLSLQKELDSLREFARLNRVMI